MLHKIYEQIDHKLPRTVIGNVAASLYAYALGAHRAKPLFRSDQIGGITVKTECIDRLMLHKHYPFGSRWILFELIADVMLTVPGAAIVAHSPVFGYRSRIQTLFL